VPYHTLSGLPQVVLRVWRASNAPDALPDKMKAVETIEATYQRAQTMKATVRDATDAAALGVAAGGRPGAPPLPGAAAGPGGRAVSGVAASLNNLRLSQETQAQRANARLLLGQVQAAGAGLEQVGLGAQMHTPFNARELMWNLHQRIE
jgi:hypothetical protein